MKFEISDKGFTTTGDSVYRLYGLGINAWITIRKASKSKKDGKIIYHVGCETENTKKSFHVTTLRDKHGSFHILKDAREQVEKILNSEYQETFLRKLIVLIFGEEK